ncbi:MAG: choice-of-anchor tandem repeat NxxGxxAF-containing protein [Phycisphaerales bacterium]
MRTCTTLNRVPIAAVLTLTAGAAHATLSSTPIALTDTTGPLGPNQGPLTFVQLNNATPAINASGAIAFRGQNSVMADNGNNGVINNNRGTGGIWVRETGVNNVRAQIGDPTPDSLTYLFGAGGGFQSVQLADNGSLAYANAQSSATSQSPGSNFVQSPGTSILNRMAVTAPGAGGATFNLTSAGTLSQSNSGQYLIAASLAGTGVVSTSGDANRNDSGVWMGSNGSLSLLYRRNMPLDALTGGVKPDGTPTSFTGVRMGDFSISTTGVFNGNGHYLWRGQNLQGSVITTSGPTQNTNAIFSNISGSLQAIARSGDMAAGTLPADNTTYGGFSTVALNNQDRYAFSVGLRVGAATSTTSTVYSNHVNGTQQMLLRQGTAVPASLTLPAGTLWGTVTTTMVLGGGNHLVFNTQSLTGPGITTATNAALVMSKPDGSFSEIFQKGVTISPAFLPSTGESTVFTTVGDFAVNALGQVAFFSQLAGSVSTTTTSSGLFAYDQYGTTHLIAQTGAPFEVAPGDIRTVAAASATTFGSGMSYALASGGQDGRASGLSDSGLFTYALRFTDGSSGVFITQIPSPGAAALLGLGGLLAARRRRH